MSPTQLQDADGKLSILLSYRMQYYIIVYILFYCVLYYKVELGFDVSIT